jgi:hypothetical protein
MVNVSPHPSQRRTINSVEVSSSLTLEGYRLAA